MPYIALSSTKDKPSYLKLVVKVESQIEGSEKELITKLQNLAKDMEKTAKLYNTINQKAYWESEAKKSFLKLLQSEGYYEAVIDNEFADSDNSIIFYINGFVRYKIKKIQFKYASNSNHNVVISDLEKLKIKEGDFAIAGNIMDAERRLEKHIERENCLLTLEVNHEAIIDNSDDTISVNYIINAGPIARVKSVAVKGLTGVNPEYARKLIPIENGQCFKKSLVTQSQGTLQRSGLFAITSPEIPDHTDENGEVPIVFDLKERKHRSLKAGFSYGSDLGFGGTLGWDHRNFLGSGETVKSDLFVNQKDQTVELTFTKPFYKRDDQTLKIGLYGENISSKAFHNKEGALSAGLERKLNDIWTAGASGKYSYSIVKENGKARNFSYFSIPLSLRRDTRDDILNSKAGNELVLKLEPFRGIKKDSKDFVKSEIEGSSYISIVPGSSLKPILALGASVGSITGASFKNIPANEKFYVGGIGSVRGYAYQFAGEVNMGNKRPMGGRSFIQTNIELRAKIKGDLGGVVFIDSGNVFNSSRPNFKTKLFHGAGFGIRYFTDFGPLRADIGFPLKRRKGVDKAFQVYFGIGQSF